MPPLQSFSKKDFEIKQVSESLDLGFMPILDIPYPTPY